MDSDRIFRKTTKGIEEVEKRTYHLDFRHRTALIQVDGHSTAETIATRLPGDGLVFLQELWRDGFIAAVDGTTATAERAIARAGGR